MSGPAGYENKPLPGPTGYKNKPLPRPTGSETQLPGPTG